MNLSARQKNASNENRQSMYYTTLRCSFKSDHNDNKRKFQKYKSAAFITTTQSKSYSSQLFLKG